MDKTADVKLDHIQEEIRQLNNDLIESYDLQYDGPLTGDMEFILKPAQKWINSIVKNLKSKDNIAGQAEQLLDSKELFYCYYSDSVKEILSSIIFNARKKNWQSVIENTSSLINQIEYLGGN